MVLLSNQSFATLYCLQENYIEQPAPNVEVVGQEPNEIHRFELLRNELMELEKRVQRSAYQSENNVVHLKHLNLMIYKRIYILIEYSLFLLRYCIILSYYAASF